MAKTKKVNMTEKIGRRGTEATVEFLKHVARAGGVMQDRRTRRDRTRGDQKRKALRFED